MIVPAAGKGILHIANMKLNTKMRLSVLILLLGFSTMLAGTKLKNKCYCYLKVENADETLDLMKRCCKEVGSGKNLEGVKCTIDINSEKEKQSLATCCKSAGTNKFDNPDGKPFACVAY